MKTFYLTAYENSGDLVLNESFKVSSDKQAKVFGEKRLAEAGLSSNTSRCVSTDGKLIIFHR